MEGTVNKWGIDNGAVSISNGVLALSGYAIDVRVESGHLIVDDGVGEHRRKGRFSRVTPELERVVVFGHSGTVSLDALRWIRDRDAAFIQIDYDGEVLVTSEPQGRANSELLRAQVLASESKIALQIARDLVCHKVRGQLEVLQHLNHGPRRMPTLEAQIEACSRAETGKELAQHEAQASLAYWSAWVAIPIRFEDSTIVPEHWQTAGSRRSPLMAAANRKAATPVQAILNYLYAIVQAEARLVALQFGFDPGIGIFHATYQGRDSLALDIMEPIRPMVDRYVLQLLQEKVFEKANFFETRAGICRIMPPLTGQLSETSVFWRKPLRDLTQALAKTLLEAGDRGSRGLLSTAAGHTAHGRRVSAPLRKFRWTPDSLATSQWKTQLRQRHKQNRAWERKHGGKYRELNFDSDVRPGLLGVAISQIVEVTGLSESYSAQVRRGHKTPHRRHWAALHELAQAGTAKAQKLRELEEKFAATDFERDILPGLQLVKLREIQAATGLSHGYAGEIRRGEKIPAIEYWEDLAGLGETREMTREDAGTTGESE